MHQKGQLCKIQRTNLLDMSISILAGDIRLRSFSPSQLSSAHWCTSPEESCPRVQIRSSYFEFNKNNYVQINALLPTKEQRFPRAASVSPEHEPPTSLLEAKRSQPNKVWVHMPFWDGTRLAPSTSRDFIHTTTAFSLPFSL